MATRRCFHCKIVLSDAFQALSDEAQLLYFRLCMAADDDGFLNNARSLSQGCPDALEELTARRFVLRIGDICVIKHWRISNSLKNDRLKPLAHPEAAQRIWVCGNRAYTDHAVAGCITLYELKTGEKPRFLVESTGIPPKRTEPKRTEPNPTEPKPPPVGRKRISGRSWQSILPTGSEAGIAARRRLKNIFAVRRTEPWL